MIPKANPNINVNITSGIEVPILDIDKQLYADRGQSIPNRGKVERRVVGNLIDHLLKKGFTLSSVYDGEEDTKVGTIKEAMEVVFNLDESRIYFENSTGGNHNVLIVLGNDGWDCISDWTFFHGDTDGFDAAMKEFDPERFV